MKRGSLLAALRRVLGRAPTDWSDHYALTEVDLVDGGRGAGLLMRRRDETGAWVYRRMTPSEEANYVSETAW